MKATLNGIVYDTDTAERLADVTHILDLFADGARQYVAVCIQKLRWQIFPAGGNIGR